MQEEEEQEKTNKKLYRSALIQITICLNAELKGTTKSFKGTAV